MALTRSVPGGISKRASKCCPSVLLASWSRSAVEREALQSKSILPSKESSTRGAWLAPQAERRSVSVALFAGTSAANCTIPGA